MKKYPSLLDGRMIMRNDDWGKGHFGAKRKSNGKKRKHLGVDIKACPGTRVYAPCDVDFVRVGRPYRVDDGLKTIHLRAKEHLFVVMYVAPLEYPTPGEGVFCDGELLGRVQDTGKKFAERDPDKYYEDHLHLQVQDLETKEWVNPAELFDIEDYG